MRDARGRQRELSRSTGDSPRTRVVCVGNSLVGDDAAGCEVYAALKALRLPRSTAVCRLDLGGISLLDQLRGEALLIVVDAVQLGAAPGTVHVMDWDHIPRNDTPAVSLHGIGVREALDVARELYPERMPGAVVLVGIEGRCFDRLGTGLSAAVARGVEEAVYRIRNLVGGEAPYRKGASLAGATVQELT